MIRACTCEHKSQDKLHGQQKRVFNEFTKNSVKYLRCTVCKREVTK